MVALVELVMMKNRRFPRFCFCINGRAAFAETRNHVSHVQPPLPVAGDDMNFFDTSPAVIDFEDAPTHSSTTSTVNEDNVL